MSRLTDAKKFVQEVQVEAKRVTWPDRKESMQATLMVVLMVLAIAAFLWLTDWALSSLVEKVI